MKTAYKELINFIIPDNLYTQDKGIDLDTQTKVKWNIVKKALYTKLVILTVTFAFHKNLI